jgi:hypothetical protein
MISTTGKIVVNPTNKVYYNNQAYALNITLTSPDGIVYPINVTSVVSLIIEDDSEKWFKTAVLVINNPDNILERKLVEYPNYLPYKFRNDGRDLIGIQLLPVLDSNTIGENDYEQYFQINYVFSVYNKEEIVTGSDTKNKNLKLYLWEFDYQFLLEQNLSWSTNKLLFNKIIPAQTTDEQKSVPTGDALKSLITEGLSYTNQTFSPDYWDRGSSKIFYSSYANNNCIEDLEYLLKKHVSSKQDKGFEGESCVLIRNRFTKVWNLVPYSTLFKNSSINGNDGSLQSEVFKIDSSITTNIRNIVSTPKLPGGQKVSFPVNSNIANFEIVDMAAIDNTTFIVDMPCYSNNIKNKTFGLDYQDNTVTALKDYIQKNYTDRFSYLNNPKTLITLNKNKKESRSLINAYSFAQNKTERFADSRNILLKSALFLNLAINFTVPGTSYRQTNTFIGIERENPDIDNDFDNKLLGQWLVTKVVHNLTNSTYTNSIMAVKVHSADDLYLKEDAQ